MAKLRVLVAEDSTTVRRRICEVLSAAPDVQVVAEAEDGKRAVDLCRDLRPDVMTLDMHMPIMSGLTATEFIMAHFPTPILIVSASTNRGDLFKTYDALAAGAVDVLEKPRGDEPDGVWEAKLVSAVKLVSRIKVITHPRARLGAMGRATVPPQDAPEPARGDRACRVVAIGASTGGPGAIVQVLRAIPPRSALPIFVVLHIDEQFGAAFAEWLQEQTLHPVEVARGGETIASVTGRVVMAPPGKHLIVQGGVLTLTHEAERHSCRPSIDVLFESLAREYGPGAAACLLTGMGRDGATGLLEIRRAGGFTLAQDEATSVVYGMPREAALLGAAERILPLGDIGPHLAEAVRAASAGRKTGGHP